LGLLTNKGTSIELVRHRFIRILHFVEEVVL
jgi:hypothetical protein